MFIQEDKEIFPQNDFVEEPEDSQPYRWIIEDFSKLTVNEKHYSDVFTVGGFRWQIVVYPNDDDEALSIYLRVVDSPNLSSRWSVYTEFSLAVISQIRNRYTIRREKQHEFNQRRRGFGVVSFVSLDVIREPFRGLLVNDTIEVEAHVAVGKAVYQMSTTENDMPSESTSLALQSLFYKLQYSGTSVETKDFMKAFGLDIPDFFVQQDIMEFNRVLREKLENKMKGTVVEGTIQHLFEGHHMNYIECVNVEYRSTRNESFYDLLLDVKGCRDVYASFDKYVEVEHFEGDNGYHLEPYGLQDARRGVLFIDFPPVLQLQLNRFEFDCTQGTMLKINDRYEFPLQLDLDRENGKYLSPEADRSIRNLYTLHSVLVHNGQMHDGQYTAYIRPTLSDQWFKFDGKQVTKEDGNRAQEDQYGGEDELFVYPSPLQQTNPDFNTAFKFTKVSNAYMLVYIRERDKDKILCNVNEKDIAKDLRVRLKKEQEEKEQKRKAKAEARFYTFVKVACNEDLVKQIGKNIYFDLVDHNKVHSFHVHREMLFTDFQEVVAKEFDIPKQCQRFWLWEKRPSLTYRPYRLLTPEEKADTVGQLREGSLSGTYKPALKFSEKGKSEEVKLFLEVELGQDLRPVLPPEKAKQDILLFFKLYDPLKEELRYVGKIIVDRRSKPEKILTKINEMAGFGPDEKIELYEEIKFEPNVMCEPINEKVTFHTSEIGDGDIICFQKSSKVGSDQYRYPDVPSFLEYVNNRQVVRFRSLEKQREDAFILELSMLHTYDDVVGRVAQHLGVEDASKIRLTCHNCFTHHPNGQAIKYREVEHLSDMLIGYYEYWILLNRTSKISKGPEFIKLSEIRYQDLQFEDETYTDPKKIQKVIV